MPLEPPNVHYTIKLWLDDQRIPTKPFIMNTLGNVCFAFFREYKDFPASGLIDVQMLPRNPPDQRVVLTVDGTALILKEFVQNLFWKTIVGFLSVLNKIPTEMDQLLQKPIRIQLSEKSKTLGM
ncbi:MAG: hypothetical protein E4G98_01610 [Promethearchaeota archaeon]|nr:MAG: hypothetical protein E4G98_01610 [Candidatus Lokiarchaeota archaeon]